MGMPTANGRKKRLDDWRPCKYYRTINRTATPQRPSIPHIADLTDRLAGATIFGRIELIRVYSQKPVAEADIS